MKIFIIIILTLVSCVITQKHNVSQVTSATFLQELSKSDFTLLYVYSSSCGYCQQFTPLYEKLSRDPVFSQKRVRFVKADQHLFKNETQRFQIFSFPTVLLFWKNFTNHPVFFREDRTQPNLRAFIQDSITITQNKIPGAASSSPYQRVEQKIVLYYGNKSSPLYETMGLVSKRDKFFVWTLIPVGSKEQQKIVVGNKKLQGSNMSIDQIETMIAKVFARVHTLGEQPWVRIFLNKQLGIVHINPENSQKHSTLLQQMSQQYPHIVFMQLRPDHSEYKAALKTFVIADEENIIAVDRKSQAIFVANTPYDKPSLTDFIDKVQKYEWPLHKKTEKTTKQQKLTRANYKQRMSTTQDVILFLYKRQQKISKNLIDLFNHLRTKLQDNQNLLFLRCDVSANEIEEYLEFAVETTPKIVFYRNRMKDRAIHFAGGKISEDSVTEFIMENTTFDWKDQWGEL